MISKTATQLKAAYLDPADIGIGPDDTPILRRKSIVDPKNIGMHLDGLKPSVGGIDPETIGINVKTLKAYKGIDPATMGIPLDKVKPSKLPWLPVNANLDYLRQLKPMQKFRHLF